jgi:hypothetical protein
MSSSSRAIGLALLLWSAGTQAQRPVNGFAVDRFYASPPGAGWFVMDDIDLHGGLGGVLGLRLDYSRNALRISDGVQRIAVVSDEAVMSVGAAITWNRYRFYVDFDMPLFIGGESGNVSDYSFTAPSLTLGNNPDVLSDARVGADVRIFGRPGSYFRLGASAQLFIPFGDRADYDTDGTFRGMLRALAAGDAPWFSWAIQLGVHIRPLDDSPAPGSPKGSELLYGVAAGARLPIGRARAWSAVVGPEIWGATAFRAFLDTGGTALEGLLGVRVEGTGIGWPQLRFKLAVGAGLDHHFGAAEWRLVAGIELFGRRR